MTNQARSRLAHRVILLHEQAFLVAVHDVKRRTAVNSVFAAAGFQCKM